jgi:single-strand DNA-binding protein
VIAQGRLKQRSFTDRDGNQRTSIELDVDEVGPSLKYATAQPQKVDRRNGGGYGAPQGGHAPQGNVPGYPQQGQQPQQGNPWGGQPQQGQQAPQQGQGAPQGQWGGQPQGQPQQSPWAGQGQAPQQQQFPDDPPF